MEVTVGGYNDFRAGFFDHAYGNAATAGMAGVRERHEDFQNEFQLEIEAKDKTSSGIEYGAVASLWNGANDTVGTDPGRDGVRLHQAYGFVNGSWGQVRAGDEHGASDFHVAAPMTYDFGAQVDGNYTEFLSQAEIFAVRPLFLNDDENSTKITYITPKLGMNGHSVQMGVSYLPNLSDAGQTVVLTDPVSGAVPLVGGDPSSTGAAPGNARSRYQDVVEVGGRYEGAWMDKLNVLAGFAVHTGEGTNNFTTWDTGGSITNGAQDFFAWDIGAQVSYAGFTVGGSYADAGRYNTDRGGVQNRDQTVWTAGATYKFDRASIGGSYLNGEGYSPNFAAAAVGPANNSFYVQDYEAWGIGAGYSLFDGMVTSVDAVWYDQDRPAAGAGSGDVDGYVVILSNRVAF
jgi:hypothetical protein